MFSPIHDHSGSHCVMKILDGELQETQYNWPTSGDNEESVPVEDVTNGTPQSSQSQNVLNGQPLAISKDTVYQPNQVTYVHGKV